MSLTTPSCDPLKRLLRSPDGRLLIKGSKLASQKKCNHTFRATVSGTAGCCGADGVYILPKYADICDWSTQNAGGTSPDDRLHYNMRLRFISTPVLGQFPWFVEITYDFTAWFTNFVWSQNPACDPSQAHLDMCGFGTWKIQGTAGGCRCALGFYALITTEEEL